MILLISIAVAISMTCFKTGCPTKFISLFLHMLWFFSQNKLTTSGGGPYKAYPLFYFIRSVVKRKHYLRLLTCLFLLSPPVLVVFAQDPHIVPLEKSTKPMHLYVQFESNPGREVVVSWATTLPGKNHVLYYDTAARNGNTELYASQLRKIHSGAYTLQREEQP